MKKIFSFVIVMAAVAMVSCCGNSNTKAADAEAVVTTETVTMESAEACDSTACCAEKCDSTKACAEKAEGECCKK